MNSTTPVPLDQPRRHRFTVDWTINIATVGTFTGGVITGVALYFGLATRVGDLEKMQTIETAQRKEKDAAVQASLTAISTDVKKLSESVDKMNTTIQIQSAVAEVVKRQQQP